ncbi:hypothetical protein OUZ56_021962 [Daphnia magna]|uniref:Uncharacterized protein n=1 Tax=Daphnia magna TaxID=35525 RepID=A0ABR0AUY4_9CRUS|nr:hypothetical protein OUZ56_021962 [Daphnia magna]
MSSLTRRVHLNPPQRIETPKRFNVFEIFFFFLFVFRVTYPYTADGIDEPLPSTRKRLEALAYFGYATFPHIIYTRYSAHKNVLAVNMVSLATLKLAEMAVRSFTAGMEEETVDEPMAIGSFCDNRLGPKWLGKKKKKALKATTLRQCLIKKKGVFNKEGDEETCRQRILN